MKKLLILLAEDNRGDVLLVREALRENGIEYNLHVVRDGSEAAGFLQRMGVNDDLPCPDLFLVDLNLPKKSGHELLQLLRVHPLCRSKPVIVVTSSDAQRDRASAAELGATRYFRKPTDVDEFIRLGAIVREVIEGTPVEKGE